MSTRWARVALILLGVGSSMGRAPSLRMRSARTGGHACQAIKGALVCDEFESYDVGASPGGVWSSVETNGSVSVGDQRSWSGRKALRLSTEPQNHEGIKTAMLRFDGGSVLPVKSNRLFIRFMYYLEPLPAEPFHWTFVQAAGLVKGENYTGVLRYGGEPALDSASGAWRMLANYDDLDFYSHAGPGSDCFVHAENVTLPEGRWTCAEMEFDGGARVATTRLRMDGAQVDGLTALGVGQNCVNGQPDSLPWLSPVIDQMQLGWESYSPDAYQRVMWVDDVVIATEAIGCPS